MDRQKIYCVIFCTVPLIQFILNKHLSLPVFRGNWWFFGGVQVFSRKSIFSAFERSRAGDIANPDIKGGKHVWAHWRFRKIIEVRSLTRRFSHHIRSIAIASVNKRILCWWNYHTFVLTDTCLFWRRRLIALFEKAVILNCAIMVMRW